MISTKEGNERLLKLADILDTADALHKERGEPTYTQGRHVHLCNTPACAWGHWVFATPSLLRAAKRRARAEGVKCFEGVLWYEDASKEFSLDAEETEDIFGPEGCDDAQTAKQAADYIRYFVARREKKK